MKDCMCGCTWGLGSRRPCPPRGGAATRPAGASFHASGALQAYYLEGEAAYGVLSCQKQEEEKECHI